MPRDATNINGHDVRVEVDSHYGGKKVTYWCANDGCYLKNVGEFGVKDRFEQKAMEHDCPAVNRCNLCTEPIRMDADICESCDRSIDVGKRRLDLDKEGTWRDSPF